MRARQRIVAVTAVGVLVFACSCRDDDWSYDGPRSPCSTGAPYDLETHFPDLDAPDALDAPKCVPRCGEKWGAFFNYGTSWSVAALPSGACSYDGEVCSMTAVHTRECPTARRYPARSRLTLAAARTAIGAATPAYEAPPHACAATSRAGSTRAPRMEPLTPPVEQPTAAIETAWASAPRWRASTRAVADWQTRA